MSKPADDVPATPRPRRSVLYVPASNARALARARTLTADGIIVDLEDAVAPTAKADARAAALAAMAEGGFGDREVVLRVNGPDTPWGPGDLAAAAGSAADAVLLPKVDGPDALRRAADALRGAGRCPPLWVMAETPAGVMSIDAIAAAEPAPAVIVMGTSDLGRDLRLPRDAQRTGLQTALSLCVLAARRHGIDILDGVHGEIDAEAAFRQECEQGRALGFDGKTLIHPRQIATANEVFGVSDAQAAEARAIVEAWETAAADGRGIAVLDGRMIEHLHAREARRLLALDAATRSR